MTASKVEKGMLGFALRNSIVISSTSATIPKENMKVVVPSMHILNGDEVKPGLLLKVICCKRSSSSPSKEKLTGGHRLR